MTCGYLYVAIGDTYRKELKASIESLLLVAPSARISLVTNDEYISNNYLDEIIILKEDFDKPYLYKIRALSLSPYNKTFFIDTDTYFCDNCNELFDLLDYFDLLISHCNNDNSIVYNDKSEPVQGIYPYNTGVILFNNSQKISDFLRLWYNSYKKHFDIYIHDQAPFMEALMQIDIKTYVLQSMYNARTPYPFNLIAKPVKIIHGRHNNYSNIAKKLNQNSQNNRIWFPRFQVVLSYKRTKLFNWYMRLDPKYKAKLKKIFKPIVISLGMKDFI